MACRRRSILYVSGAFTSVAVAGLFLGVTASDLPVSLSPPAIAAAIPAGAPLLGAEKPAGWSSGQSVAALVELAQRNPMALARLGQERYAREVREYRCILLKQERLNGKLTPVQQIEVRYRESPLSVYMIWLHNADRAKRALFIDDPRYIDANGEKLARVEPAGCIIRLFVNEVMMPIHGPDARATSRRSIDEFGFKSTFELLERYNRIAKENGVLDLRYGGVSNIDGRPTYVLVRDLPYEGPAGAYPDARMVLHLDQEWLLPLAVYSYADHEGTELLGSYLFTDVDLDPGFGDDAFHF